MHLQTTTPPEPPTTRGRRTPVYVTLLLVATLLVLLVFVNRLTEDKSVEFSLHDGTTVVALTQDDALEEVKYAIHQMTQLFEPATIMSYHTLRHLGIETAEDIRDLKGRLLASPRFKSVGGGRTPNAMAARRALQFTSGSTVRDAAQDLRIAALAAWSD